MFGKQYANHLDILTQSLGQMSKKYQKKIKKNNLLTDKLKTFYISAFGIPEIGFQIRSIYFKQIISSFIFGKQIKEILDAGCGIGAYTFWLAEKFPRANVTGGEIDREKIRSCLSMQHKFKFKNIEFKYLNITRKQQKPKYDLIIIIDVLEHIENYETVLKNFYKLLNKKGYLYIHVPQPNQKRIFNSMNLWHHDDHIHEGIEKSVLEKKLKKIGFEIIVSRNTFGFFGKLSWELNHLILSKNFIASGIFYPFLYMIAKMDSWNYNKSGLCMALLAQKK